MQVAAGRRCWLKAVLDLSRIIVFRAFGSVEDLNRIIVFRALVPWRTSAESWYFVLWVPKWQAD